MGVDHIHPGIGRDFGQEIGGENLLGREALEKPIRKDAARGRNVGAANVTPRQADLAFIVRQKIRERLDQSAAQKTGNAMVDLETFVGGVALVSGEELIATISSK